MPRTTPDTSPGIDLLAPVSESDVERFTDPGSFSRGRSYFRQGRIHDTRVRDRTIEGFCDGSALQPYHVKATLASRNEAGRAIQSTLCTCPVAIGCKHAVALLLTWIASPEKFTNVPPLAEILGKYTKEELVAIVERMVQQYPTLEQTLDLSPPKSTSGNTSLDKAAVRRHARAALTTFTHYEYEWGHPPMVSAELENLVEVGRQHVASGQFVNAITIFEAVSEEIIDIYEQVQDEEGDLSGVLADCDEGLGACLEAQAGIPENERLDQGDREALIEAGYAIWRFDVLGFGIGFAGAALQSIADHATGEERARVEGWLDAERTDSDWARKMLVEARVMLREQAGVSDEELIALYREADLWDDIALLLIERDRIDEAMGIISHRITQPGTFLKLANALIAHDPRLVDRAITLVDDRAWEVEKKEPHLDAMYRRWLADTYQAHGKMDRALPLVEQQFRQSPSLTAWQAVRKVATDPKLPAGTWDALRPKLIGELRKERQWGALIDILLDEDDVAGAVDAYDASKATKRQTTWPAFAWGMPNRDIALAMAAEQEFPERSIEIYQKNADSLIERRGRENYVTAADYLSRVKRLMFATGREAEWGDLIATIRTTHKALRALREELDKVGLT